MKNKHIIEKEKGMLVPGAVYASDKIFNAIKEDKTIEQIKNVAKLPGIVGESIALADCHRGYGFPIGGVAAFDLKKGIISPGGVGYDINCLTGDSKILTEFGESKEIQKFQNSKIQNLIEDNGRIIKKISFAQKLPTINFSNKKTENKEINLFMFRDSEDVFEINLNSGLKIKATSDHPFLTKEGMALLKNLILNQELAVNFFEGVINDGEEVSRKEAIITKIFGYLLGDGCVYESKGKMYGVAYGEKEDLEVMKTDLLEIGINSGISSRKRNHKIKTKYGIKKFESINNELHIYSKEFLELLVKLGMPKGNKTRQEIRVPKWIKKSNKVIKRLFLAGFFGAELSTPKTHTKTGFYSPILNQNKIEPLKQNCREFLIDLSLLLEDFGIITNKISEMNDYENRFQEKTMRFRLIISAKEDNLIKLWRNIGFEYNKKRQNISNLSLLYILLKKEETQKRINLAKNIKDYKKKGFSLKEVQKILEGKINSRFIERYYYENVKQRINLDFISFEKFKKDKLEELKKQGCIFDKIRSIKKVKGTHKVYDFNLEENHNFVANGFIVSNCGVLLLKTNLTSKDLNGKEKVFSDALQKKIPSGVGRGSPFQISYKEFDKLLEKGAQYLVEKGYGVKEDYLFCEEEGCMKGANPQLVSDRAKKRGVGQLGTLGAGNHFLDVLEVEKIYDKKASEVYGLKKNQLVVLVHCGSRGLGHQVASDYIKKMEEEYGTKNLPDRELACAPINSKMGKEYLQAMAAAANFAFANKQIIIFWLRELFTEFFPKSKVEVLYEVCHNIAKIEEYVVDGKKMKVCVHRKGATRSFGRDRKEVPLKYRKVGQPVLIPGSMGTASYVMKGTKKSEMLTFGSSVHGAGRVMSRTFAIKTISGEETRKKLVSKNIIIRSGSNTLIAEESPEVYKNIDEVVDVVEELGISKKIAKLKPRIVLIG
ncbi:RNA-splicing ligase RtcB [Candidatus Pacearchaeota archaeon CG_4_9_14_0_2_um_filter_30_8]|nr:MAG: RNA-splicing ligase RtcB [Candidatus Pacearchaeota archaeon CG_4_9_14_0_2_um_filter_30_8]